jgi:hypothetical protein
MRKPVEVIEGQVFGRLTVLREVEAIQGAKLYRRVECKCRCGNLSTHTLRNLRNGDTRSCGCLREETIKLSRRKHGHLVNGVQTPEYTCWWAMKMRCENHKSEKYHLYGGRGIRVCEMWNSSFEAFFEDMGCRPSPEYTLDRIDTNGDYYPENCRWVTQTQQMRNIRRNIHITSDGKTRCLSEWAELAGIPYSTLYARIKVWGWDIKRALITPTKKQKALSVGVS